MAEEKFFANTLAVSLFSGATEVTVGLIKNVEISVSWENKPLYGMDSIIRADIAKVKMKVDVTARYAKFHGKEIGLLLGTTTADKDVYGATATGRTKASVTDSNTSILFDIKGQVSNGALLYTVRATNVAFDGVPNVFPEDEWIALELTGEGDNFIADYLTT